MDIKHIELVIVLGLLTALGPLSIDMYLPSFPEVTAALHTDLSYTQYSLASFFLGLSIGQLFYGPITDRFGRKWPLIAGLVIYTISAIGCAMATTIESLIVLRFFQAIGCSAGSVITRAAVRDLFDKNSAARVFSSLMLVMGVSPILAPMLGGYINHLFGWQSIFWFSALAGALSIIMVHYRFPETHAKANRHTSISLNKTLHTYSKLFMDRHFMAYTLTSSFALSGLFSYIAGSSFVLMTFYGVAPTNFGWFFGANAAGFILFAQVNRYLLKRNSTDGVLKYSLPALAIFGASLLTATYIGVPLFAFVSILFCFTATLGMVVPNSSANALANQGKQAGSAAAMMGALQFIIAFAATSLVSHLHNTSALPMAQAMFIGAILANSAYYIMVIRTKIA
jgi:DHA1 family bicyclomycin/chloramphenicol resistance-like MFS transporter